MDQTARNSDCQFCRVRFQNSGEPTYSLQLPGSCRLPIWLSAKALKPLMDCTSHDATKMAPITRPSEFENTLVRQPPALAQVGESGRANGPRSCSLSDSLPRLSSSFDS